MMAKCKYFNGIDMNKTRIHDWLKTAVNPRMRCAVRLRMSEERLRELCTKLSAKNKHQPKSEFLSKGIFTRNRMSLKVLR